MSASGALARVMGARGVDALAATLLGGSLWTILTARPSPAALPVGSDWPQYLGAARMAAGDTEPSLLAVWPDWREAVYPRVLGTALAWTERAATPADMPGAHVAAAAHLVGVVCVAAMFVGGWALARALGGARAGLATAGLLAVSGLLAPAAAWLNPYALLAGLVALALAGAAACLPDDAAGRPVLTVGTLGTGVLAGVAWGVDPRGGVAALAVVLAVLAGRVRLRPVPRGAMHLAIVLAGIALGRGGAATCAPEGLVVERVPFSEQVQRQVVLAREEIVARGPAAVVAACGGGVPGGETPPPPT